MRAGMAWWHVFLQLISVWSSAKSASAAFNFNVEPGCRPTCGNVGIPYPFGIGQECSLDGYYILTCNDSYNPPKPFWGELEVLNISLQGQMSVGSTIGIDCYNETGVASRHSSWISLYKYGPFTISSTHNWFTAIGCDTAAFITGIWGRSFETGCMSYCSADLSEVVNESCSGIGCCQTSIPAGVKTYQVDVTSGYNHSSVLSFNPCSYVFLIDKDEFKFSVSDLFINGSYNENTIVPVVLDWMIGNETCESATRNSSAYACRSDNSYCSDSANIRLGGYSCSCNHGYRGNPYLQGGCIDIDECLEKSHNCTGECRNIEGSYECYCPKGTTGNGRGTICAPEPKHIKGSLGIGLCFLIFLIASFWIYWAVKKREFIKLKQKFFQQNGGLLLQQHINSHKGPITTKIFSEEELQRATNNFDERQIVGRGGYGTVYEGILTDQKLVAVKKSKFVDETQIEQFINEVFILSQINHRNVVKLLGCCLETQVPLLVYEFVSNGTLFHHIHDEGHVSSLALEDRLRVACETAGALAYLHSAASMPIFHRDVKSTNILLDDNLTAKVSDFGASRLVPLDQTQISTLVQGTLGYLDPEYFQTGQLTEKSDVYSFGVVLVELITGLKPICPTRTQENRNLSMCFISSMKEKQLFKILEHRVVNEGDVDQLTAIAELAARCLRLDGEERPTMKEVAMELEGIRRFKEQPWILKKHEKGQSLQGEPFELDTGNHNATVQDSLGNSWNSRSSSSGAFVQDTFTSW